MKQSANPAQYITQPPNIPYFLFKYSYPKAFEQMIAWAKKEFQDRLQHCASKGYWRSLKYLNEEYSPMRILAEVHGYRRMCAYINQDTWNKLSGRDRVFIRRAYEMRELLFSN